MSGTIEKKKKNIVVFYCATSTWLLILGVKSFAAITAPMLDATPSHIQGSIPAGSLFSIVFSIGTPLPNAPG